jgi:RimJ/RimL family protein N-acetyltransferase
MLLQTRRLILRAFEEDDWQAVYAYAANPAVLRYMPADAPTAEQVRQTVQWMIKGKEDNPPHYDFAVILKTEPHLIGWCSVSIRYDELRQGELAYAFNPQYWTQGYATEAAIGALRYGFSELDLHRIFATCRPDNVGSWRVLEKVGMQREGHLRQHRWVRDSWQDSFLYAILDYEWQARQEYDQGTPKTGMALLKRSTQRVG